MRLFLDCEFNSYQGDLISMALVSDDGREWYEVLDCADPHEWVAHHVMPVLGKRPLESALALSKSLEFFLSQFDHIEIITDWPDDISYFCKALITGPGDRIDTPPLTMQVFRVDAPSKCPHNALADARGLREYLLIEHPEEAPLHTPGSPSYMLDALLNELRARFPGAVSVWSSEPSIPKYMAAIDRLLDHVTQCSSDNAKSPDLEKLGRLLHAFDIPVVEEDVDGDTITILISAKDSRKGTYTVMFNFDRDTGAFKGLSSNDGNLFLLL